MDPDYQQFGSPDVSSVTFQPRVIPRIGTKRLLTFVPHAVVLLLLLILLMVTSVKFSQLNKEVRDIRVHLETMSHGGEAHATTSDSALIYLEKLKPVRGGCTEGWVSFNGRCYLLSDDIITWSQAEKKCQTHGAHLLVPNNQEELDFISSIVEIQHSYWIGLVERHHEGHWSWVDGTDYSTSEKFWDDGQPDNWDYRENGEDCGQIQSSSKRIRKLWNDADCQLQHRYICEARL